MNFRLLRADEIDCRISILQENGLSLLLYKDARVDQNILDETVGSMNWQRHHSRDNANCIVSIWDKDKNQWIEKEDTGTESYTEKEKGLASDSFKRACFNWGIGRELYSAPFIWVKGEDVNIVNEKGKLKCKDTFEVAKIEYDENRNIVALLIANTRTQKAVFSMGKMQHKTDSQKKAEEQQMVESEQKKIENSIISEVKVKALLARCVRENVEPVKILKLYKVSNLADLNEKQYRNINEFWEKIKESK